MCVMRFLTTIILFVNIFNMARAGIHEDTEGWCIHGSTTATTDECICSTQVTN